VTRLITAYLANISIRRKLMALIMATCGVILLATTVVFVIKETSALISEQRKNLASLADILGKNVSAALTFNDPQSALDTMNSLSVKSDILAAYVLKADTTVFSRYLAPGVKKDTLPFEQLGPDATPVTCNNLLRQIKSDNNRLVQLFDKVNLVSPVLLDNQTIGTVVLFADMRELRTRLVGTLLATLLILGLAAVAAYLLSMRLQGIISDPILELADTMRQVSETKDFALRVNKPGNDEIGRLYDGFNEMLQEIEERNLVLRQRQEHLQELAHFDTLTRLPNRVLFHDRLQQSMNLSLRTNQIIAVMFLDLDRFKDINDTLGHRIGDLLLQQVADRMGLVLRDCDTVARLGGDEFTIFTQDIKTDRNACRVAQKLLDLFEIPYNLEGQQVYVTCSIGLTLFPADGNSMDELLMNADIAMYHAKADGKNTYRLYASEMNQQASERVALQTDLRKALDLDQLYLQYQPKFDANSSRIIGVEALLRWQHPERGLIPPTRFIPLAEESGNIIGITEWVLKTACHQAKLWYDAGYENISVAVNLSAYSLKRNNAPAMVQQTLEETGLPAHLLELELTESMLIENDQQAEETLLALKLLGVNISIDDFGTGYSSLSYLHRFPIDALKIDRSFIWNMHRSENDMAIVVAIIAMGHGLKLQVIAEGVETDEQLSALKQYGCETIQGYLMGRPVGAEEVTARLQRA
jgi:diguanylate cyclase